METLPQSAIDFPQEQGISHVAACLVAPQDDRNFIRNRSMALRSAVRLLGEAERALRINKDEAQACIAKAAALLQAEADLAETGIGTSPGPGRQRLAPWQVARVARFVDAHLSEKIAVATLAGLARLSSGHFARAFRATAGESPHAYVIRRRIERAEEQILSTKKSLAEIALDCGFGDQAHMTRLFHRIVGVSPGAWRRAHGAATRDCDELVPDALPSFGRKLVDINAMRVPAIAAE
jgi:AraC family transcriptional regulator